jgi:hypothetical protein
MTRDNEPKPVTGAIYGYAGRFLLNGRNVLIVTDSLSENEATMILRDVVEQKIVRKGLRIVTVISGMRSDLFPHARRCSLDEGRVLKRAEKH